MRPALGALLLTLSGMACGDDGSGTSGSDTANDSQPPMPAETGPMPNPTTNEPPMVDPSATAADTGSTSSSDTGNDSLPPMPPPQTTSGSDSGTASGSDSGSGSSTGPVPPMPPPDGGGGG